MALKILKVKQIKLDEIYFTINLINGIFNKTVRKYKWDFWKTTKGKFQLQKAINSMLNIV